MPDTDIGDFSTTAASNSTVGGINIAEGMTAAQINDALRAILAVLAGGDFKTTPVTADIISESTAAAGVTIDGMLIKDGSPVIQSLLDSNGNEVLSVGETAAAVNEVTVTNAATAGAPQIAATGDDTNIDLNLVSKGAGNVQANGVDVAGMLQSVQVFTSTDTWTRPSGCKRVFVRVVGGGGGGGGSSANNSTNGGGGGGGGYAEKHLDVTSIASSTITVGAAGSAGTSTGNGGAGGNSSWADGTNTVAGNGGAGGDVGTTGAGTLAAGGTATGGDINITGQSGCEGGPQSAAQRNGEGGSSSLGHGGRARSSTEGASGTGYGGGGAGGNRISSSAAGGAGAAGVVIVEEYY